MLDADLVPALEQKADFLVATMETVNPEQWHLQRDHLSVDECLSLDIAVLDWLQVLLACLDQMAIHPTVPTHLDPRLEQALLQIHRHALEFPLDQHQLAASVGFSLIHLTRLFRQHLGKTPMAIYADRRLNEAKRLLVMPDVRVAEASAKLGFPWVSHFSKWFKQQTGLTPSDFIQARRPV